MRPFLTTLFALTLAGVGACSGSHEPPHDQAVRPAPKRAERSASGLNVPGLLSLSIDEMSKQLGPRHPLPEGFLDPVLLPLMQRHEPMDSSALFRQRGLNIVASYDNRTRKVNNLLILGSNENELMRRAQLQLGAERYLVLPVFQEQAATQLLGLRVLALSMNQ